ncbi:chaperone modulator CbpM [Undibacterium sp. RTI2.1]|uniref:chaperone modulator CbpM n=1 Tax=unclassified Undibacterium TaxID=2630295 RepID=UPI002B228B87|nr:MULTISPECIES: chaperone modulator CbpM [unclassified Undibacterium]MEB0033064.1 chaperone modulator CbpM [Undibacterium sp. RTI2.1]MEB0118425.1 chaperone modulator CbpM [Undibacterium sp. RTI2.2]
MNREIDQSIWLNHLDVCQIDHLIEVSGLSLEEIEELIDHEIIVPLDRSANPRLFYLQYVMTVKMARRLRDDFQLDRNGLSLALTLLQRVQALEAELKQPTLAASTEN